MAGKVRHTRPELKRQREALARYERYLPMLKLKQQLLQFEIAEVSRRLREAERSLREAEDRLSRYDLVLAERAAVPLGRLTRPVRVRTGSGNVAGVPIPVFEGVDFHEERYSLFGTPPWVDRAIRDLRDVSLRRAAVEVVRTQDVRLRAELRRMVQRVNLFEKVKIPEARDAIRVIRIYLGDELTAAVCRAKTAKSLASAREGRR